MLNYYKAMCVQVVLESLPVSSSGHIRLLELFLHKSYSKELMYVLHIPTLIILIIFFYTLLLSAVRQYKNNLGAVVKLLFFIVIIDGLTALFYIFFEHYASYYFLSAEWMLVIGLTITMLLLYTLKFVSHTTHKHLTCARSCIIGIAQGCALLPGVSRFATVYTVCNWLGMQPSYAFYMTWLIQAPLIITAVAKTVLFKNISQELSLLLQPQSFFICLLATIVAYYALAKSYEWAIQKKLWRCAYYMIFPLFLTLFYINYYT